MQRVTLDNLVISSEPEDTTGPTLKLTRLENWYSSAPVRADITNLPLSDGGFAPERTYRSPKTITIEGWTYGGTAQQAVEQAWEQLAAIAPDGGSMLLTVEDESSVEKHMRVYLTGAPVVEPLRNNAAKFQFSVTAPDPRKYGPERSVPTGVLGDSDFGLVFPLFASTYLDFGTFSPSGLFYITNNGTAESWPTFKVQGAITAPGFQILSAAQVIEYSAAVPTGTEVLLSPYAGGRASIAGQDVTSDLTRSEWPSIKPGETRLYIFNPVGTANATAMMTTSFSDAWW